MQQLTKIHRILVKNPGEPLDYGRFVDLRNEPSFLSIDIFNKNQPGILFILPIVIFLEWAYNEYIENKRGKQNGKIHRAKQKK